MIGPGHFLVLSGVLVGIGLAGVLGRRDGLAVVLSLQVMFIGAAAALVGFTRLDASPAQPLAGAPFALAVVVAGAAEGVVGVAVLLLALRRRGSIFVDDLGEPE